MDSETKAKISRDITLALFEQTKRGYIKMGIPADEADELASRDVRRAISGKADGQEVKP